MVYWPLVPTAAGDALVRRQLEDGRVALIAQTIETAQHRAVVREALATSGAGVTTYQSPFLSE